MNPSTRSTDSGQEGSGQASDHEESPSVAISIVRGDPTPTEVAAVTAVVSGALEELANANAREALVITSAWQRGQRNIRGPITPGPGSWRSFNG